MGREVSSVGGGPELFSFLRWSRAPLFSYNISASTTDLPIFNRVIAVNVLHEYIGYTPQVGDTLQGASSHKAGTVPILAWLDAFTLAFIYCFCSDGINKVGGHHHQHYFDTFSSFLPISFSQPIRIFFFFCASLVFLKAWDFCFLKFTPVLSLFRPPLLTKRQRRRSIRLQSDN